jgi:hypothetical protein
MTSHRTEAKNEIHATLKRELSRNFLLLLAARSVIPSPIFKALKWIIIVFVLNAFEIKSLTLEEEFLSLK